MASQPKTDQPFAADHTTKKGARLRFSLGALRGLPGLLVFVALRLWSHLGLMLALAAGYAVAVALVVSVPVYSEAVGYRVLRDQYIQYTYGDQLRFNFLYRYLGAQGGIDIDQYNRLATYVAERAERSIQLPVVQQGHYISTEKRPLSPPGSIRPQLASVNFAFAEGLENHIDIVAGQMPQTTADGPIQVLMSERLAERLEATPGQEFFAPEPRNNPTGNGMIVSVAGTWRAKDSADPYWFYSEMLSADILYIPKETYTTRLLARDPRNINVALWFMSTDGSVIRSADVANVQARIDRSVAEFPNVLPGAKLDVSPGGVLRAHQERVQQLTVILTVFSIPLFALICYFVILIAGLVIQRQSSEIAVLRSRGVSRVQILGIFLIEGALLALLALIPGPLLGQLAALLMTWVRSFLDLAPVSGLPIEMTPDAWKRAAQILGLLIVASLVPAFGASRYTIISYKRDRERLLRPPLWQRLRIDLILLALVAYGYVQLWRNGSIAVLGIRASTGDPFTNPLLLLAPTMYIFVLGFVGMRLFPKIIVALAKLFETLPGISALTALRYLARTPRSYAGPVLLLVLTLSLSIFTASMAHTLDRHLFDRIYYAYGGDMQVTDQGRQVTVNGRNRWEFRPVRDYLTIPGVTGVTRLLNNPAEVPTGRSTVSARFIGIDRSNFPGIARWRSDYADAPVRMLMNQLANPENVLISRELRDRHDIDVGDPLLIRVYGSTGSLDMPVTVAGVVNLFPTIYPEDGPFIIGNIGYVFTQAGSPYPYDVLLRLDESANRTQVEIGIRNISPDFIERGYAPVDIAAERVRPERQGLFGLLSVGFVAAAFLTVLGFLFYAVLAFQRRFVEMGMLRAIGLSTRQLGWLLTFEQASIIAIGVAIGTAIGVTASMLFIPFLQVRSGEHPQTPPFFVEIAWSHIGIIYLVFGTMLLGAVIITLLLLRRMKLFQAVKLGEAI